jgi:hypothetical protein
MHYRLERGRLGRETSTPMVYATRTARGFKLTCMRNQRQPAGRDAMCANGAGPRAGQRMIASTQCSQVSWSLSLHFLALPLDLLNEGFIRIMTVENKTLS